MRLTPRKRLMVDPKVQGALMLRAVAYWCFTILAISQIMLAWKAATGPPGTFWSYFRFDLLWQEHGMVAIAALIMLPVMLVDVMSTSNKFAGPVYRMRRSLRALSNGEYVAPIHFRKGDFWPEFADEFNILSVYVENLKQENAQLKQAVKAGVATEDGHLQTSGR